MNKVYVLIEENSPELAIDNGSYEIIGIYNDYKKCVKQQQNELKLKKRRGNIVLLIGMKKIMKV